VTVVITAYAPIIFLFAQTLIRMPFGVGDTMKWLNIMVRLLTPFSVLSLSSGAAHNSTRALLTKPLSHRSNISSVWRMTLVKLSQHSL
jgi:hypothetical protein